jgi:hypothetical protein
MLVDRIAAFITDNLTSEQILSEDYFRFADNPGVNGLKIAASDLCTT